MFIVVAGKRYTLFPTPRSPLHPPPLTTVMSSEGTSTLAFEVACFSEHILNFVSCVVCFVVALPVSVEGVDNC